MVKALCDNEHLRGKLFFVGDFKQSIYRFRGAEPHVFRELRDEIPAAGRNRSRRTFAASRPCSISSTRCLPRNWGRDYEPLRPHRPQLSEPPAVEFLWACPNVLLSLRERTRVRAKLRRRKPSLDRRGPHPNPLPKGEGTR